MFADEEYTSFYSITALDFYLEKINMVTMPRDYVVDLLSRTTFDSIFDENSPEFSERMMGDVLELMQKGLMKEPETPAGGLYEDYGLGDPEDSYDLNQEQYSQDPIDSASLGNDQASQEPIPESSDLKSDSDL